MSEPRLFFDARFLSSLIAEFEAELGSADAFAAFFQIGLTRGLRESGRIVDASFAGSGDDAMPVQPIAPPLAIRMGQRCTKEPGRFEIPGEWPERFEASARLAKLGPADSPSCALSAGFTSGWLSGVLDAEVLALETQCSARGDETCSFVAREASEWRGAGVPEAIRLLEQISFDAIRGDAARTESPAALPEILEASPNFDPDAPVVHLWGPVMVLPFTSPEEALRTTEMLGSDAETSQVRAVVVDLRGSLLDESFGAAALERILGTLESWGAEAILTGVSPLCEEVVHGLETQHLLLRKDLPEAIAAAFQIAEAQRHLL